MIGLLCPPATTQTLHPGPFPHFDSSPPSPKTAVFEGWEGEHSPPPTPPNTQGGRKKKKKGNLILCCKISKGLDQHLVAPIQLTVSLHFTVVWSRLLPFSANTTRQKTTVQLYRSEDCSLISQKWLHNQRPKQTDS